MSYILEALKKAQAERQLGNAPTIHAPPVAAPEPAAGVASRKPLLIGLGAGALVVAAGALWLGRPTPAPQVVAQAPAVPAPRPAAPTPTPAPAPAPVPVAAQLEVSAPPAPPTRPPEHVVARVPEAALAATHPAPSRPAPEARTVAPMPAPAPEASLPFVQQLPEAQQRDIPRVTFGGYMYSSNPSDRLLIVDKALRHEGEEIAPGLVLEKLLPKAAVMNYRGTRYRVAY